MQYVTLTIWLCKFYIDIKGNFVKPNVKQLQSRKLKRDAHNFREIWTNMETFVICHCICLPIHVIDLNVEKVIWREQIKNVVYSDRYAWAFVQAFHQYLFIIWKCTIIFPLYAFNFWNSTIFSQFDCKWQIVSFLICGRHNMWIVDIFMNVCCTKKMFEIIRDYFIYLYKHVVVVVVVNTKVSLSFIQTLYAHCMNMQVSFWK